MAQALVPAASTLVSRPGSGEDSAGVETSLDAARKSACATKIVAAHEGFQVQ